MTSIHLEHLQFGESTDKISHSVVVERIFMELPYRALRKGDLQRVQIDETIEDLGHLKIVVRQVAVIDHQLLNQFGIFRTRGLVMLVMLVFAVMWKPDGVEENWFQDFPVMRTPGKYEPFLRIGPPRTSRPLY